MQKDVKVGLVVGLVFVTALIVFLARQTASDRSPGVKEDQGADLSKEWEDRRLELTTAFQKQPETEPLPGTPTEPTVEGGALLRPDELEAQPPVTPPARPRPVTPPASPPAAPAAPAAPQTPRTYVVKKGDTLSSIAREQYGDVAKRRLIQKANNLSDPNRIFVGQKLILPHAEKSAPVPAAAGGRTYRVKKGDTLWSVAERFLGDGKRWREIQRANADQVNRDGTNLREGMVLVIPAEKKQD